MMTADTKSELDRLRTSLIDALMGESPEYSGIRIPDDVQGQRDLLRALMNIRPAGPASDELIRIQDAYLSLRRKEKGVVRVRDIPEVRPRIRLWQGDITRIEADAIVNAANSGMTGCYQPNHACIDNCIHTFAGIQLRQRCSEEMIVQGHPEPTGSARITPGYNLPARNVIHTVGPIVHGELTGRHHDDLASCYRSCMELADANGLRSIVFCCISTGVFGFPGREAAEIAVDTVSRMLPRTGLDVVFDVFTDRDREIYESILG